MNAQFKRYLSPITIFLIIFSLLTGVAFGGVAGYVTGSELVSRSESFSAQPISSNIPLDLDAAEINVPLLTPLDAPKHAEGEPYSTVEAVEMVLPAVVTVIKQSKDSFGSGSGFFISDEGYVVTNYHVVKDAKNLGIIYAQGGVAEAELIGAAPEFDLAVIKVDGEVPAVAQWGDSGAFPLGTQVIAIGSALGRYQNTVTAGILSGYNRELGGLRGLMQTDAAINQGNSGGPLINLAGKVIGINTLVVRGPFAAAEGLSFAIPSTVARTVVEQLISTGKVQQPFLGIQYRELYKGAVLKNVTDDTPAHAAGLQTGDVIIAVEGQLVDGRHPLVSLLINHGPGETITLQIMRDGKEITTKLTLGEQT